MQNYEQRQLLNSYSNQVAVDFTIFWLLFIGFQWFPTRALWKYKETRWLDAYHHENCTIEDQRTWWPHRAPSILDPSWSIWGRVDCCSCYFLWRLQSWCDRLNSLDFQLQNWQKVDITDSTIITTRMTVHFLDHITSNNLIKITQMVRAISFVAAKNRATEHECVNDDMKLLGLQPEWAVFRDM